MIETPQSILAPDGTFALRALVAAGGGRVRGAHFGVYDYTALCGITAAWQHPRHLACDFARHMMQVALAQTGVFVSDGSSNIMPIRRRIVHTGLEDHFADVTHSLVNGFYQGWDLHPGAAAHALRRRLRVLPLGAARGDGATEATSSRRPARPARCSTMRRRARRC